MTFSSAKNPTMHPETLFGLVAATHKHFIASMTSGTTFKTVCALDKLFTPANQTIFLSFCKPRRKEKKCEEVVEQLSAISKEFTECKNLAAVCFSLQTDVVPEGITVITEGGNERCTVDPATPIGAVQLDFVKSKMTCGDPTCTVDHSDIPLRIIPGCHKGPTLTLYEDGVISIVCMICGDTVMRVKVADK